MAERISLLESKNAQLTKRAEDLVIEKETLRRDVVAADERTEAVEKKLSNAVVDIEHGFLREEQLKHDVASPNEEIRQLTARVGEKERQLEAREAAEEERKRGSEVVIRRHLKARLRWENMDRLLSQAEGTLEYLEALREDGVAIPERTIRRLTRKKLRYERRLARLAYRDISAESLALGSVEMTAESKEEIPFSASSEDSEEEDWEDGEEGEEDEYDEDVEGDDEDIGVHPESDKPRSDSRVAAEITEEASPSVDAEVPTSKGGEGLVDVGEVTAASPCADSGSNPRGVGAKEQAARTAEEECEVEDKGSEASMEAGAAMSGGQTAPIILETEAAVPASAVPPGSEAVVPAEEQEPVVIAAAMSPGDGMPRVEAVADDVGGPVTAFQVGDGPGEQEREAYPFPGGG